MDDLPPRTVADARVFNRSVEKLAYTIAEAADACGIGVSKLRQLIANNDISVRYIGSKPVILHSELLSWPESLPTESSARPLSG